MRPETFEEFLGQEELIGPQSPLRQAINKNEIGSLIFWGPSGSGKTTLAHLITRSMNVFWEEFSAVATGLMMLGKPSLEQKIGLSLRGSELLFLSMKFIALIKDSKMPCCHVSRRGRLY